MRIKRGGPSQRELRRADAQRLEGLDGSALRAVLGVSTWTSSRLGGYVGLAVITVSGGTLAAMFATATGPIDPGTWVLIVGIFAAVGCALAWFLFSILNPPWVRVDAIGATVGGARSLRLSPPPKLYRWEECGQFTLHTITSENARTVARCTYRGREVRFENAFGDPVDLVTILNAYRSAYGSTEPRQ